MISIIIIAKNEEKNLPPLLKSISIQEIRHEVILSDANSTDNTRKIARSFGCRIVKGGLPSVGRNNGAKAARYDHLLFLDADVVLPKGFLKNILNAFRRGISVGTVTYTPITEDRSIKAMYWSYNKFAKMVEKIHPLSGGFCIFTKRSLFNKIGGFKENLLLNEDHDFVDRASKIGKFKILTDVQIYCDVRRIEIEGKGTLIMKYAKGAVYNLLHIEKPAFEYVLHGCDESVTKLAKSK